MNPVTSSAYAVKLDSSILVKNLKLVEKSYISL
jgi:hypothetical protein